MSPLVSSPVGSVEVWLKRNCRVNVQEKTMDSEILWINNGSVLDEAGGLIATS